jgi:hypothetical protein
MLILEGGYSFFNTWEDISIKRASNIVKLPIPALLKKIYDHLDKKEFEELKRVVGYENCVNYYKKVMFELTDIPKELIDVAPDVNVINFCNEYTVSLLYQLSRFSPIEFKECKKWGKLEIPKGKKILSETRPFNDVSANLFCELSDMGSDIKTAHVFCALMLSKSSKNIEEITKNAEVIEDMSMDVYWNCLLAFAETHLHIRKIYPDLFKGKAEKKRKSMGWRGVLLNVAEKKIFDKQGMNSIESVEESNMWDFLEVVNKEKILNDEMAEKSKKK